MSTLRKVLFLVFTAVYLVAAPLTILYALGYIFNPDEQKLLQTGLVSLVSDPSGAEVWVDGKLSRDKTPVVFRNLSPGTHETRVTLPGHHPWQEQVKVVPERALRFENILLFPETFVPEILGNFPVSRLWHVPGGKYIFVLQGKTTSGLSLFDPSEKKFKPLVSLDLFPDSELTELLIHPEGNQALLLQRKDSAPPLLIRLTEPPETLPHSHLLSPLLEEVRWDRRHNRLLFYLQGESLKKVDLEDLRLSLPLMDGVAGYTIHRGKFYVLDRQGRFLALNAKGKLEEVFLDDPAKARLVFGAGAQQKYRIFFLPNPSVFSPPYETAVLFLSSEGRLSSNKLPYFLDEGAAELVPAFSHPRAAYRKGPELWVVDFDREEEKTFFETGPTPRRVHKGSDALSNLLWTFNDQYLIFLEGNRVMAQDFEGGGKAVELFRVSREAPEIVLDSQSGFLYFAEPAQNRLARVKLHAPPGLIPRLMDDFVEITKDSP